MNYAIPGRDKVAEKSASSNRYALSFRSRSEVFACLAVLGACNGLVLPIYRAIIEHGLWRAVSDTFGVSAFVWIAMVAVPVLMLRSSPRPMTSRDNWVAGVTLIMFVVPLSHLSWIGLSGLGLYLIYAPASALASNGAATPSDPLFRPDPLLRRAAIILLATTTAMFWGRLFLQNSGSSILTLDAAAVSFLTGMGHQSNVVETAGSGHLWIAPYCSSLSNISLALLCSALVVQWRDLAWTKEQFARCLLAIVLVVVINDVRISIMVLRPDLYETVHGATGSTIANLLTVAGIALAILIGNECDGHNPR
jgi:exosortase/archaeosortase family protein